MISDREIVESSAVGFNGRVSSSLKKVVRPIIEAIIMIRVIGWDILNISLEARDAT